MDMKQKESAETDFYQKPTLKKERMKNYIIAGILYLISIAAYSQPQSYGGSRSGVAPEGTIKGQVMDGKAKRPMEFASIALYRSKDSTLVTGGISSEDGTFTLRDVPVGKYYLEANFMGYNKKLINNVMITPQKNTFDAGSISLLEATQNLDEVEVVANQARVEYKIDRKVISVGQDINAATGTAADVLQNTPSVSVDIDGNVSLRGSSSFTVLIDGKPTPLSGSDALQQIPASAIRNIEIITNPSAKFDPDGMAGIINILTKKNALQGLSGVFNAKLGTQDKYAGDFLLSYRTKKYNVYGGLTYQNNQYNGSFVYKSSLTSDSTTSNTYKFGERNMHREGKEGKLGIDYYLNDKNTLSLSGEIGDHSFSFGGIQKIRYYGDAGTMDSYTRSTSESSHGGNYFNTNLSYTHKFDDKGHELVAFANYSKQNGNDWDHQFEYATDSDFRIHESNSDTSTFGTKSTSPGDENEFRAQIDYTKPLGENGRFQAGYQARVDDEYEAFSFYRYQPESDIWTLDPLYTTGNKFFRDIQAVYTTYGNKIGNYQFQAGLRGEYTDRRIKDDRVSTANTINRFDLFPTLHLARNFENGHQVMLSYSRRINRPRGWYLEPFITYIDAHTVRKGDPNINPEYLNSYELGYQKTFGTSFISLEAYYKNTIDKIDRIIQVYDQSNLILLHTYGNVATDNSLGAELMINYAQLKWLELNLSGSLYRYSEKGKLEGLNISRESTNWDSRLNVTVNFSTKTRLQVQAFYGGPSVTIQGKEEGYMWNNVAVRHDFLDRKLSATLQIRDLLGSAKHISTSYGESFSTYMKYSHEPRVIMLSLSYKLNNFKQRRQDMQNGEGQDMSGEGEVF